MSIFLLWKEKENQGTNTLTKLGILKIEPEINNLVKEDFTAKIVFGIKVYLKA